LNQVTKLTAAGSRHFS